MKIRSIIFLAIFLAISAVYVLSPKAQAIPVETVYLIAPIGAALIGLYTAGAYGLKSANGRALLFITGGLVCYAIAETIWYISVLVGNSDSPSIADVFYLLAYPFLGAGIYQGFRAAGINLKTVKKSLLAIVISVSIVLTILVLYFSVYQAYDPTEDALTNTVNLSYGLVDLILVIASLLTVLVASEYRGGKLASFWKIMTVCFLLNLIGDISFAIFQPQYLDDIKPYVYIDLIWTAEYIIIAFAMLENYLHIFAVQKNIKLKLQQRQ